MKYLLVCMMLALSACGGEESAAPALLIAPVTSPAPDSEPVAPAPELTAALLAGKTISQAGGSLTFTSTHVVDTRCGLSYPITASSESAGVVTISTALANQADYTSPSHNDCIQNPDFTLYYMAIGNCAQWNLQPTTLLVPFYATYTIIEHNGGYQVTRMIETKRYLRSCTMASLWRSMTTTMQPEMYNE